MQPGWENISDAVFHWAERRPQVPAFIHGPKVLSYGDLATLVGKAAVYLDSIGIRAGDRIAVNLTNSIDHFILSLGLLRLGATTIEMSYSAQRLPGPPRLTRFSVKRIFIEPVSPPVPGFESIKLDAGWRGLIEQSQGDRRYDGDGDSIYTITLTSGTTGQPKGSLTTHRQYFRRAEAYHELFAGSGAYTSEDPPRFLLTASIGFSTFYRHMISQLFFGGSVVILPEFLHAIDLVKAIADWDDAHCLVTSATCRFLISCAPKEGLLLPRLRVLVAAGGFLYAQEKLSMLARVTPNFHELYGASGFGSVAVLKPKDMRERPGSVGQPSSVIEVQVVDEAGQVLPAGAIGRLRCRGTEGKGFAAEVDPASDERFQDGWYLPGDFAYQDDAGFIFLRGRSSDVIRRNGLELFASEIEAVIVQHPTVAEVAVVGVPRPMRGEDMVALVVPRGQAQHEALAKYCQSRLPSERWPDRVFYANDMPKTANGKVDRVQVKALVIERMQRGGRSGVPPTRM